MKRMSRGFTLIELIVVIGIIAVLAGLILVRISDASGNARDARRESDLSQVKSAIEQYKVNGGLPCSDPGVATLSKAAAENDGTGAFRSDDTNSKRPADYLAGDEYPKDPGDDSFYSIAVTNTAECLVTLTAAGESGGIEVKN